LVHVCPESIEVQTSAKLPLAAASLVPSEEDTTDAQPVGEPVRVHATQVTPEFADV
jgi:hypothetical protein